MISQLRGKIIEKNQNKILLDVSGVGYEVELTATSMSFQPPLGEETILKTFLQIRDDKWQLYGFSSDDEKVLFEKLINISGIGPKIAIAILSASSTDDFINAVANEDIDFLSSVPRLGSKNAKRIVLELKGKIATETQNNNEQYVEAKDALRSLGYSDLEINKALSTCNGETNSEKIVKQALRYLANG